jgi:hypothetical protein
MTYFFVPRPQRKVLQYTSHTPAEGSKIQSQTEHQGDLLRQRRRHYINDRRQNDSKRIRPERRSLPSHRNTQHTLRTMPCNERTTMKPDGSKTVRKEHIDPTTGKCIKIEITEYPSPQPDFSVMSSINKKPKTTIIYPEDTSDQDTGFHDTLMPVIGKTTVGKTTIKTVETKSVPQPTSAPIKVAVPTIHKAPVQLSADATDATHESAVTLGTGEALSSTLQSTPASTTVDGGGGCCVVS